VAWWFAGLLGVYVVVELAVCVWMPSFLLDLGASPSAAAWALTVFFALRAAGRFAGIVILRRWRWPPVLAGCAVLALAAVLVGSLGGRQAALWALPASGLFLAPLYPTLNSHLLSRFPAAQQASVAGLATFCSATGAALGSWTIATASQASGDLRSGLLIGAALAAVLAVALSWQAWRRPPVLQLP
jgi:fucose permease